MDALVAKHRRKQGHPRGAWSGLRGRLNHGGLERAPEEAGEMRGGSRRDDVNRGGEGLYLIDYEQGKTSGRRCDDLWQQKVMVEIHGRHGDGVVG